MWLNKYLYKHLKPPYLCATEKLWKSCLLGLALNFRRSRAHCSKPFSQAIWSAERPVFYKKETKMCCNGGEWCMVPIYFGSMETCKQF